MSVWAIADLHLSFGVPNKKMDVFGSQWTNHADKVFQQWNDLIQPNDLVLLAGDFSWAKHTEEARPDFEWINQLPGTKVFIKGNHDYWWSTPKKIKTILPSNCHLIQNDSFVWEDICIAGTRLWDVPGLDFRSIIDFKENPKSNKLAKEEDPTESQKIYSRELLRLETSLKTMDPSSKYRIAMVHYPPIGLQFEETEVSKLLEKYHIDHCIFGHLHSIKPNLQLFGEHHDIHYHLTACDYLNFIPRRILG